MLNGEAKNAAEDDINLMADCIVEETEAKMNVYDAEYDNTKVANFEDDAMIFFNIAKRQCRTVCK